MWSRAKWSFSSKTPNPLLPLSINDYNFSRISTWETRIMGEHDYKSYCDLNQTQKILQKNNNTIKKITTTNSNSEFIKEKKIDWFSHLPKKVQKPTKSNNQTNLIQHLDHMTHVAFHFYIMLPF